VEYGSCIIKIRTAVFRFLDNIATLLQLHIHRPPAEGDIKLRPLRIFDSSFVHAGLLSDDLLAANGLTRPITSSQFLTWSHIKKRFVFSYCILANGRRVGFIGLHSFRPCATAEVSLAIFEKDMRRRGYGSRAFQLFLLDLQKHQSVKRVVARVSYSNSISLSFWKKLGFEEINSQDGVRTLICSVKRTE
jgi:L-amino acid N-acyltransferase YncA